MSSRAITAVISQINAVYARRATKYEILAAPCRANRAGLTFAACSGRDFGLKPDTVYLLRAIARRSVGDTNLIDTLSIYGSSAFIVR